MTCPEQLVSALAISQGELVSSIIILATGTRVAARNFEKRSGILVEEETMREWKTAVSPFGLDQEKIGDPSGDTYHFWTAVLAGASLRDEKTKKIRKIILI